MLELGFKVFTLCWEYRQPSQHTGDEPHRVVRASLFSGLCVLAWVSEVQWLCELTKLSISLFTLEQRKDGAVKTVKLGL